MSAAHRYLSESLRAPRRRAQACAWTCVLVAAVLPACSDWGLFKRSEPAVEPVIVEETFVQAPLPQVDVLWVIDDTGSMAEEQEALSAAFGAFLAALEGLELAWQTGVVTMESEGDAAGVLVGNPWIIHPDLEDPLGAFQAAVDVGSDGVGGEAGLAAAWLALTEPLRSEDNRGFRRPGAALHVVVVSDADDDSSALLGADPAETFLAFLDEERSTSGAGASLSAVIGPSPDGCETAQPGIEYSEVALGSGGAVASICKADFSAITEAIGQASVSWPDTFPLQECPVEGSVVVRVDGVRAEDPDWSLDLEACALVFVTPPPPGSTILVRYELQESAE